MLPSKVGKEERFVSFTNVHSSTHPRVVSRGSSFTDGLLSKNLKESFAGKSLYNSVLFLQID